MAIKLRIGQVTLEQRAAALAMFNRLIAESFTVLAVTGGNFRGAAKFVDPVLWRKRHKIFERKSPRLPQRRPRCPTARYFPIMR